MRFPVLRNEGFEVGEVIVGSFTANSPQAAQKRLGTFLWLSIGVSNESVLNNRVDGPLFPGG